MTQEEKSTFSQGHSSCGVEYLCHNEEVLHCASLFHSLYVSQIHTQENPHENHTSYDLGSPSQQLIPRKWLDEEHLHG